MLPEGAVIFPRDELLVGKERLYVEVLKKYRCKTAVLSLASCNRRTGYLFSVSLLLLLASGMGTGVSANCIRALVCVNTAISFGLVERSNLHHIQNAAR